MASVDNLTGKCILVTGGAGFIGSHLCRKLTSLGCRVVAVDNFCDYYSPDIKEQNITELLSDPLFSLYRADIRDGGALSRIFSENQVDVVVHLAAMAGVQPSIKDPLLYNDVNVMGTAILLEACRNHHVKKLVFASSSSVYGNTREVPFSEAMNVDNPISPYAATKKAGELMCHTWHHLHQFSTICLRFFTVYGPGQRPDLAISKFIDAIYHAKPVTMYGDGSSSRDYTYIDDIVAGIMAAVNRVLTHTGLYEVLNLGNSTPVALKDMIRIIGETLGKQIQIIQAEDMPGDVWTTYADTTQAFGILGYKPDTPFTEGVKRQVSWYLNSRNH